MNRTLLLILAASVAGAVHAQTAALITEGKASYNSIKNNLLKAADKMPEDAYSFKPTPELQSFGERVAHVAGQIGTCSGLTGERKPNAAQGKTAKADLVAALKASFDACDAAWDSMTEASAAEMVAGRGGAQRPKIAVLIGNTMHIDEVYGTMTVYMRLKGVVPPSSEGGGMGGGRKGGI
ncbi:MAG TPA: DinB family protein [Bryobacteraceae bacterium]|nr:DinB family protein [Bryobacteraceae bacterium]